MNPWTALALLVAAAAALLFTAPAEAAVVDAPQPDPGPQPDPWNFFDWPTTDAIDVAPVADLPMPDYAAAPIGTADTWLPSPGVIEIGPQYVAPRSDSDSQLPSPLEALMNLPSSFTLTPVADAVAQANERAVLDMIAWSEGTAGKGDNGYNIMFGGATFPSYADHPRVYTPFTDGAGRKLTTSAAGRYQFLARTWDALAQQLGLPDFGPASQDRAALELIRQRGALNDVRAGRITAAITKIAPIWASLPGAGYAQPERKLTSLLAQYRAAGGNLEA